MKIFWEPNWYLNEATSLSLGLLGQTRHWFLFAFIDAYSGQLILSSTYVKFSINISNFLYAEKVNDAVIFYAIIDLCSNLQQSVGAWPSFIY